MKRGAFTFSYNNKALLVKPQQDTKINVEWRVFVILV